MSLIDDIYIAAQVVYRVLCVCVSIQIYTIENSKICNLSLRHDYDCLNNSSLIKQEKTCHCIKQRHIKILRQPLDESRTNSKLTI